jgi:hypothetical protein
MSWKQEQTRDALVTPHSQMWGKHKGGDRIQSLTFHSPTDFSPPLSDNDYKTLPSSTSTTSAKAIIMAFSDETKDRVNTAIG